MATHSSILAWKIPWTEESGNQGVAKSQTWLSDWMYYISQEILLVQRPTDLEGEEVTLHFPEKQFAQIQATISVKLVQSLSHVWLLATP